MAALAALSFVAWSSAVAVSGTPGSAGDATADRVLGQVNFTNIGENMVYAIGLSLGNPIEALQSGTFQLAGVPGVVIDGHSVPNHIYQADGANSRVLGWRDANGFANGDPADIVIGQPDFYSYGCNGVSSGLPTTSTSTTAPGPKTLCVPAGVAVDRAGSVYVSDSGNNRVLQYKAPFAACKSLPCAVGSAKAVLGQGTGQRAFASSQAGTSRASLSGPEGLAIDNAGNLYVADTGNNRVLEFKTPLTTGVSAQRVFGQAGFSTGNCNGGTAPGDIRGLGADSLCVPAQVAVDSSGNLWVSDSSNNRVLEYDNPSASTPQCRPNFLLHNGCPGDTVADRVFGQRGSFVSNAVLATGPDSLRGPSGVVVDAAGNLYISDGYWRVLEYDNPLASGGGTPGEPGSPGDTTADRVFGQNGDFTTTGCGDPLFYFIGSADTLCVPAGLAVDSAKDRGR